MRKGAAELIKLGVPRSCYALTVNQGPQLLQHGSCDTLTPLPTGQLHTLTCITLEQIHQHGQGRQTTCLDVQHLGQVGQVWVSLSSSSSGIILQLLQPHGTLASHPWHHGGIAEIDIL